MTNQYAHRDGRNDADHDERYGAKQQTQGSGATPLKKRGRPPKSRIEIQENEDLEMDAGKEQTGGYPDPSQLPRE
jgi:hypothetical protein